MNGLVQGIGAFWACLHHPGAWGLPCYDSIVIALCICYCIWVQTSGPDSGLDQGLGLQSHFQRSRSSFRPFGAQASPIVKPGAWAHKLLLYCNTDVIVSGFFLFFYLFTLFMLPLYSVLSPVWMSKCEAQGLCMLIAVIGALVLTALLCGLWLSMSIVLCSLIYHLIINTLIQTTRT